MSSEDHGRDSTGALNTMQEPGPARAPSGLVPELSERQHKDVARRTRPSAVVVHETVREEGEQELQRTPAALGWSALAAGLSMEHILYRLHAPHADRQHHRWRIACRGPELRPGSLRGDWQWLKAFRRAT